jgi:hypothetical protein
MSTENEVVQRAMLMISDLAGDGGLLNPEQNNTFIRLMMDEPTLLQDVRTIPMSSPTMKINKIGFGSRVMRPARQTEGVRALTPPEYAKPTTTQIELETKEVICELHLPYEVLEDNIEKADLENTILSLLAERAALDFEDLLVNGDTTGVDDDGMGFITYMDGALKQIHSNTVDAMGAPISATVFNNVIKALPTRFRRNRNQMRLYVPMNVEQDYRLALSSRGSPLGDATLTGDKDVPVFGVGMKGAALMKQDRILFTNPSNIIFGVQRNIRIETQRLISEREIKIVMTARVAIAVEQEEAAVKVINLGGQ